MKKDMQRSVYNYNRVLLSAILKASLQYPGQAFKVPTLSTNNRWLIVCNSPAMLEDIRKASDEYLSFGDASLELLQMDHTMAHPNMHDEYHADVVRGPLTRGFPSRFDDIKDEIQASFKDIIPTKDGTSTSAYLGLRAHF